MAKRAPVGEGPFRPLLDVSAISAALKPATIGAPQAGKGIGANIIELSRPELGHRDGHSAANEALSPRSPTYERRNRALVQEMVEKLDQEKRMLLTRGESMALERLVSSLASRVNTQIKLSHVLRSLVTLLLHAEGDIDRRASETVGLSRPTNGDFKGLQRFEREIAKIIAAGLRDSGPLRDS